MRTNLDSVFFVSQAVARHMIPRKRGKIINIGSVQSELGRPSIAPYAASKGAVKMLTKGMCADWAPHGLQVNGIGPGYFETELTKPLVEERGVHGLALQAHPGRALGQGRGAHGRRRLPRLRRIRLRQRPHPLCRRRHDERGLTAITVRRQGTEFENAHAAADHLHSSRRAGATERKLRFDPRRAPRRSTRPWLAQNAAKVDGIVTGGHLGAPPSLMTALPNLKVIGINGVGFDKIDLDLARSRLRARREHAGRADR